MSLAKVLLWGTHVGTVASDPDGIARFSYERDFLGSRIEIAPRHVPLSERVYRFPSLPRETFHGLPGFLADSLPDRFGNAVIDAWLAETGRTTADFSNVDRLLLIGRRAMGALEFEPAFDLEDEPGLIDVGRLVSLASEILSSRRRFRVTARGGRAALNRILEISSSAGGARAKALVAVRGEEIRSGQIDAGEGYTYWLLKLDGVSATGDPEVRNPRGYGRIEYAYSLMAKASGIDMPATRLWEEGGRAHFMAERFDRFRRDDGKLDKLHMLSLGGLEHLDYNQPRAHAYEQALDVMEALGIGLPGRTELVRRAFFNVVARNQDDHVKNIAFLMDRAGTWTLSPAFDLSYAYNPDGDWTAEHQMRLSGRTDGFGEEDLLRFSSRAGLTRHAGRRVLDEVREAVRRWPELAEEAAVEGEATRRVADAHRLALPLA